MLHKYFQLYEFNVFSIKSKFLNQTVLQIIRNTSIYVMENTKQ